MAFSDDIATMQAAVYARYGVAALWTPKNGVAKPVTLLPDQADQVGTIGGVGRNTLSRNVFRCRVSEMVAPAAKDGIQLIDAAGYPSGKPLTVVDPPARDDTRQTEWTLVCSA